MDIIMEIKYYRKLSSSKDDNLRLQLTTHVSLQVNCAVFAQPRTFGWAENQK